MYRFIERCTVYKKVAPFYPLDLAFKRGGGFIFDGFYKDYSYFLRIKIAFYFVD